MKPTMAILERLESNSKNNHDQIFTRVFRYLLRPEIYFMAYKKLYANKGSEIGRASCRERVSAEV